MHQLLLLFCIAIAMCTSFDAQAQTKYLDGLDHSMLRSYKPQPKCDDSYCIHIVSGLITDDSVKALEDFIDADARNKSLTVIFSSPGGDIYSAMKIGRILRSASPAMAVVAPKPSICASSCVLAFVGATTRVANNSSIGIHRPYTTTTTPKGITAHTSDYRRHEQAIRNYLVEMNIPASFLDEMLRYPAETIHLMTTEELSRYRISGTDHIWQDKRDSELAKKYNIDKAELLSRKAFADRTCNRFSENSAWAEYAQCREDILSGKR